MRPLCTEPCLALIVANRFVSVGEGGFWTARSYLWEKLDIRCFTLGYIYGSFGSDVNTFFQEIVGKEVRIAQYAELLANCGKLFPQISAVFSTGQFFPGQLFSSISRKIGYNPRTLTP